ncbi:hypothetical protein FHR83_009202 [Actinoplanes campanulatus]|uniref:DUF1876 domain-containing protein n=1 Tax=Actinoplanes campanulatus TaxID=113559 RepID=A0A7W5AS98_9ACTN|nr:dsRBD fold-containing protein [Actinoplanes campanulatus]MBB3101473.1 hypothetical protein [Actinoplanes campanulatus]
MSDKRTWTVEITIAEHEEKRRTYARAVLRTDARMSIRGEGRAARRPSDMEVAEIGDELAAARALADLSHQLMTLSAEDIAQVTQRPMHLTV